MRGLAALITGRLGHEHELLQHRAYACIPASMARDPSKWQPTTTRSNAQRRSAYTNSRGIDRERVERGTKLASDAP